MLTKLNKMFLFIIVVCVFVIFGFAYTYEKQVNEHSTETTKVNEDVSSNEPTFDIDVVEPTEPTETLATEPTEQITEPTEQITEPTEYTKVEEDTNLVSLGEFRLTAYCPCSECCGQWAINRPVDENGNEIIYGSMGVELVVGTSIAVDTSVIPYGTKVVINGHTYIAQDTGYGIVDNCIDIYFNSHEEALDFGLQYAEVFLKAD